MTLVRLRGDIITKSSLATTEPDEASKNPESAYRAAGPGVPEHRLLGRYGRSGLLVAANTPQPIDAVALNTSHYLVG
ncbi:MAG TPA: hypothetical protein VJ935_06450 [Acidimicrobiia bacterium]|nr:hypothetical protein [Acidimicrobiia bacterium]